MRFTITLSPTYNQMNLQENIDRIKEVMGVSKRVYDYEQGRNTVPDRLPLDVLKLIDAGVLFITPAIDGDPESPTYKEWLDEPGSHIITLYNVENSSEDGWIKKAITKQADPTPFHRKDFTQDLYDGKYNQILWGLEKLGIDPNTMLFEEQNINEGFLNPYLRRRLPEFLNAVVDTANEIFVRSDREFDENYFKNFLDRTIFYSIRNVIENYDLTHEELEEIEKILLKTITQDKELLQTLKQIFISKLDLESVNESVTPYLKRRFPELVPAVIEAASWYMPSFMPDFQTYVDRAIYSGIISVIPDSYADAHADEMYELEDIVRQHIYNNAGLYEKFKSLYTASGKKYEG